MEQSTIATAPHANGRAEIRPVWKLLTPNVLTICGSEPRW
jgi:hypothetical protein